MKIITSGILSLLLVLFTSCKQIEAQKSANSAQVIQVTAPTGPSLDFETPIFEFGKISQGEVVKHDFTFVNNGKVPVLINQVKASCGCTVGDYKKEPILPGESSVISASFNSKGKSGKQRKTLNVFTNATEEPVTLTLSGEITTVETKQTAGNQ